jgi:hypothetical protein
MVFIEIYAIFVIRKFNTHISESARATPIGFSHSTVAVVVAAAFGFIVRE